jgi:hypothetical protein
MPLHPQDVVVVLKLVANRNATKRWSYAGLGKDLFMSGSQVFRSVARAEASRLLSAPSVPSTPEMREALPITWMFPNNSNLKEFLIHGVRYSFPVERAGPTRGTPTAEAAPPLNQILAQDFPLPPDGQTWQVSFAASPFRRFTRTSRRLRCATLSCTNSLPWWMPFAKGAPANGKLRSAS